MKSIIIFIIIITSFFIFNQITINSKSKYSRSNSKNDYPCCNSHKPTVSECSEYYYWSLTCVDSPPDVVISCECCRRMWDVYGQQNMNTGNVPCPSPLLECPSDIERINQ